MKKISVIVPVYNNKDEYLRTCIESVLNQTIKNIEIILVDDGAKDNCGKICDEYAEKDDRIIVIHKENAGVSSAINVGIKIASGEWITIVDHDDWCNLNYYEELLNSISSKNVDVIISGGFYMEYSHKKVKIINTNSTFYYTLPNEIEYLQAKVFCNDKKGCMLCLSSDKLYRTDFIRNNNIRYNTSLSMHSDTLFNFTVFSKATAVIGSNVFGYHKRNLKTSVTGSYNPKLLYYTHILHKEVESILGHHKSEIIYDALTSRVICDFALLLGMIENYDLAKKKEIINNFKYDELCQAAIWNKSNIFLGTRLKILKNALRFNNDTPVLILASLNSLRKKAW